MGKTFSPELKWLIMKFETQEMNGLSSNPWSKHITEEYLSSAFMEAEKESSLQHLTCDIRPQT